MTRYVLVVMMMVISKLVAFRLFNKIVASYGHVDVIFSTMICIMLFRRTS
jgi:hypothetical protein